MNYPRIIIDLNKIRHNTEVLVKRCEKYNIDVAGVSKVFCGIPEIVEEMIKGGIRYIADSRIENLSSLSHINIPKILLRLPMISEAKEVVNYADISLNSEIKTIFKLNEEAKCANINHKIILMIDLGDLREGLFLEDDMCNTIKEVLKLSNIKLYGIGTNLSCYGGVIPDKYNLSKLVEYKVLIETKFSIKLDIISGGNSSSLYLVESGSIPKGINNLRLGESILLGRETAFGNLIKDTYDDCFILQAEIIELKEKPSVPIGEIGMDAFGNKPTFTDKGIRKRAILALGKQDIDIDNIISIDKGIDLLGSSSDHLIVDVTDSENDYKVGDIMSFKLTYGGVLKATTSKYVKKVLV